MGLFEFDPSLYPKEPGVYLFRDANGKVLYVGKAIALRERLRSYARGGDGRVHIGVMLRRATQVETIVTDNEVEALILENNLIKEHRPRYNVTYRDDKSYPYIRVTKEEWPRIFVTRNLVRDGSRYFGPYIDVKRLRAFLRSFKARLQLRDCELAITAEGVAAGKFQSCLDLHIGKCLGPCVGGDDRADYHRRVETVVRILKGQVLSLRQECEAEMASAAGELRFEDAARCRDTLAVLEQLDRGQKMEHGDRSDQMDLLAMAREDRDAAVVVLRVREGRMVGRFHSLMRVTLESSREEILERFLFQYYTEAHMVPPRVLLPLEPGNRELLERWLGDLREGSVRIDWPKRGEKKNLLKMAESNARHRLGEWKLDKAKRERVPETLAALARDLDLKGPPRRIEGFDVSHYAGEATVASMVVFQDGKPLKRDYRIFNIRETAGIDDFASIGEAVRRRYSRMLKEEKTLPDLVLIDGGKGQLGRAHEVLRELGLDALPVIGLAKRFEEVFVPGESLPRNIPKTSAANRLLQHIRDEAHRFAITRNRDRRSKERKMDFLDELPGLGPVLQERLLKHFGSLKKIRAATAAQLAEVQGISLKKAEGLAAAIAELG